MFTGSMLCASLLAVGALLNGLTVGCSKKRNISDDPFPHPGKAPLIMPRAENPNPPPGPPPGPNPPPGPPAVSECVEPPGSQPPLGALSINGDCESNNEPNPVECSG